MVKSVTVKQNQSPVKRTLLNKLTSLKDRVIADDVARDSAVMTAFTLLAGVFNYLYQLSMGIMLTPVEYGALLSFFSLFTIISLFSQAIQTATTKFTSKLKAQHQIGGIRYLWGFSLKRMLLASVGLFIVVALLTPLISSFLKIDNYWYSLLFSTSLILVFAIPVNYGLLQGLQRFLPLGISTTLAGLLKLAVGALLVYLGLGVYGGLLCLPIALVATLGITCYYLKDVAATKTEKVPLSGLFSYTGLALVAIASFGVFTNVDVILAKHYLGPESAGNYAVISVLGRVALFAPLGVAVAMFPKTSDLYETLSNYRPVLRKAILFTVLLAGGVVVIFWLFPDFIINLLFADKYPLVVPYLFRYTLAMALFALSFLFVNYFLSINRTRVAYPLLGTALVQVVLIVLFHSNIGQIVITILLSSIICLALMLLYYLKVNNDISNNTRI